jgi:hypothetical protein
MICFSVNKWKELISPEMFDEEIPFAVDQTEGSESREP